MFANDHKVGAETKPRPVIGSKPNLRGASAPAAGPVAKTQQQQKRQSPNKVIQQNKYSNNVQQHAQFRDSSNYIAADESINQRDFEETVFGENSGNL